MNKQLEIFCNANGIPMNLRRPWYWPRTAFRNVQKTYHEKLRRLYDAYTIMMDMYRNYCNLYKKTVGSFKNFPTKIHMYELPPVDYSNVDRALQEIRWTIDALRFGKSGGAFDKLLRDQEEALFDYRHKYIQDAIHGLPKSKNVVVITTHPTPSFERKNRFNMAAYELSSHPTSQIVAIHSDEYYEWVAFCPKQMTYYDMYKVFDLWKGDPRYAETKYL